MILASAVATICSSLSACLRCSTQDGMARIWSGLRSGALWFAVDQCGLCSAVHLITAPGLGARRIEACGNTAIAAIDRASRAEGQCLRSESKSESVSGVGLIAAVSLCLCPVSLPPDSLPPNSLPPDGLPLDRPPQGTARPGPSKQSTCRPAQRSVPNRDWKRTRIFATRRTKGQKSITSCTEQ